MRYLKIKHIITIWLLCSVAPALFSQENNNQDVEEGTINKEVKVVREYNPTISDAFKINDMPSQSDTLKASPVFKYQLTGKPLITPPEISPMVPARLSGEPLDNLYPVYIHGYLGNYEIMGGGLLYNLVRHNKFALSLNANHESSFGNLDLENGKESDAYYHETNANLYMRHFFEKSTLSVDMGFLNYAYRYYGQNNMDKDYSYISLSPVTGSDILNIDKQRQTVFDVDFGLANRISENDIFYNIGVGFSTFGNLSNIKENNFRIKGNLDIPLGELGLRVSSSIDHVSALNHNTELHDFFSFADYKRTLLQLNPSLISEHGNFFIKLGFRMGTGIYSAGDEFYLSPDIEADFTIRDVVVLQAGITGDIKSNSYRNVMAENPFLAPDVNVMDAFHGVKFFAGIKGKFSSKTSFGARVEYGTFTNEHFFVNRNYGWTNGSESGFHYDNKFDVLHDDGFLLTVSGEFKAQITPELDVTLRGAYYGWQVDTLEKAWHKPDMEIGLRAAYSATRDLKFTAAINILGERFAQIPTDAIQPTSMLLSPEMEIKRLKPVFDFNVGANYTLNSRWYFFGTIQNLISSKYYKFYGYPMHGINARVGVGYSF